MINGLIEALLGLLSSRIAIVQIEIMNWKYTKWKHEHFAKTPIYRKNVFTLTWGVF